MSKEKSQSVMDRFKEWTARAKVVIQESWQRTPLALRYAGIYLLAMVLISSLMFWRFNPAKYSFSPPGNNITIPGGNNEEPGQEPGDVDGDEQNPPVAAVFDPGRGDKLSIPLEGGRFLDLEKYVFHRTSKTISFRFVEGVHISGEAGAPVRAVWSGVVQKVQSGLLEGQEIWIDNGSWTFIYRGINNVMLSPGDKITHGQNLGVLANNESAAYNANFLELCVQWDGVYFDSSAVRDLLAPMDARH